MISPPEDRPLKIANALMVDPATGSCGRRDLLVHAGKLVSVDDPGTVRVDDDCPVRDASDRLVMPGLINAHTHGHANLMKGVADRWILEASLTHGPWLGGDRDPETIYLSTLLGAAEMVLKGCTACYDLVYEFPQPSPQGLAAVAKAYADVGMRAVLAPMIADRTLFDAIPGLTDALPPRLREQVGRFRLAPADETFAAIEDSLAVRENLPGSVSLAIAPTIPHHCSDQFLRRTRQLAERHDLRIHMHVAESRLQAITAQKLYGCSLTRHLAEIGLLGPKFTAAHAIWLDGDDLDLLAEAGAAVAHIPASNFRLGSGLAAVRPMLDRGITIGLATDGANSSDSINMFEAARLASFTSRAYATPRDSWISSREALTLATQGGAAVLGLSDISGRIAPGHCADLVFLDLGHVNFVPLNDPINQIVNCEESGAVVDVMINGRFVVEDRRLTTIDTAKLRRDVAAAVERLRAKSAPARNLAYEIEPFTVAFAERFISEPIGIERHVRPTSAASKRPPV